LNKKIGKFLIVTLISLFALDSALMAKAPVSKAITEKKQAKLTPQDALALLKAGNQRFMTNRVRQYDYNKEMKVTTKRGQHPLAIILNCIDSRSIPELLFDQGLGNIFAARVAGNIVDKNILGSMEFATSIAGASVIVVMGHTHCGAVQGACAGGASGNLGYLLSNIKPAVSFIKNQNSAPLNCNNPKTIDEIAKQNVLVQLQYIVSNSPVIAKLIKEKEVEVIGAMHDIRSGRVDFFDLNGKSK
jgi:carbonic anhydrase